MRVLAKTKDMTKEEWLKIRQQGIGGSDAASILGCSPYKSAMQVYMEKTNKIPLKDNENDYLHFGSLLEDTVRKEFSRRTGLKVRKKNCILQHDTLPFLLANLDGVVKDGEEMAIFEAKTASEFKKSMWQTGVPPEYLCQLAHYFAVTGFSKAYVACLVGGNSFYIHEVQRDEKFIQKLIDKETAFWNEHVMADVPPKADGSTATSEFLAQLYTDSSNTEVELPEAAEYLFKTYDKLNDEIKVLTEKKEEISNQFKQYLQEDEVGVFGNRRVTWRQIKSNRLNSSKLKAEQPQVYDQYVQQTSYRRLSIA